MTAPLDPAIVATAAQAVWRVDHLVEWALASPAEREQCIEIASAALSVALPAAIETEREACAKIAEKDSHPFCTGACFDECAEATGIAKSIRGLSPEEVLK